MVFFLIVPIIIVLDLLSKRFIKEKFKLEEKKEIIKNKFYIWRIKNTGCAYSMLEEKPSAVIKLSAAISAVLGFSLCFGVNKGKSPGFLAGLSMCLGGALGNLIDRIKNKGVTDFIYIKGKNLPIFNLADIFIFVGVIVFITSIFSEDK